MRIKVNVKMEADSGSVTPGVGAADSNVGKI